MKRFGLRLLGCAAGSYALSYLPDVRCLPSDETNYEADEPPPVDPEPRWRLPDRRKYGSYTTVLSIDGGGIRGLIPSVVLSHLEGFLKEAEEELYKKEPDGFFNEDPRIADYFDVIAGTSTGGLIAAMLTIPAEQVEHKPPKLKAKNITQFYKDNGPKIFCVDDMPFGRPGLFDLLTRLLWHPKYDGEALRDAIKKQLQTLKLADTVTRIMVMTFDVKKRRIKLMDSRVNFPPEDSEMPLADVCIATTAAPVFFPAHGFPHAGKEHNLIDGGVVANDPILHAIWQINTHEAKEPDFNKFLVVSVGTGYARHTFTADECRHWGIKGWFYNKGGHIPLLDIYSANTSALIRYNTGLYFLRHKCPQNYLRIDPELAFDGTEEIMGKKLDIAMDNATKDNMDMLIKLGRDLLTKDAKRIKYGVAEWIMEPIPRTEAEGPGNRTNQDELRRFAKDLCKERHERLRKKHPAARRARPPPPKKCSHG